MFNSLDSTLQRFVTDQMMNPAVALCPEEQAAYNIPGCAAAFNKQTKFSGFSPPACQKSVFKWELSNSDQVPRRNNATQESEAPIQHLGYNFFYQRQ